MSSSPKKKSSNKKTKKKAIRLCKSCNTNTKENKRDNSFHEQNDKHHIMALDYCEEHETMYSGRKCEPRWCEVCGYLEYYEITINQEVNG